MSGHHFLPLDMSLWVMAMWSGNGVLMRGLAAGSLPMGIGDRGGENSSPVMGIGDRG